MRYYLVIILSFFAGCKYVNGQNSNAPVISNVHILGEALYNTTTAEGSILRAGYIFTDDDGHPDGSLYQWFYDENSNGTFDGGDVSLGTAAEYTVTTTNVSDGKEIFLEVTAKDDYSPPAEELTGNTLLSTNSAIAVNSTYSNESQLSGATYADGATHHFFNVDWDGSILVNFGTNIVIHGDLTGVNNLDISVQNNSSININGMFITGNNSVVRIVSGEIYVGSGIDASNSLVMNIDGTLRVDGNFEMGNSADIDITGYVGVSADMIVPSGGSGHFNIIGGDVNIGGVLSGGQVPSISGGGTLTENHGDPLLPIVLSYFKGSSNSDGILLIWETASEENNDYFTIFRSTDAINFTAIAKVPGAGNSSEAIQYKHIDNNPDAGVSYYMLKQTDYNGDSETFPLISVLHKKEYDISVIYNNSSSEVKIDLHEDLMPADATLILSNGAIVKSIKLNEVSVTEDVSTLNSGTYILKISSGYMKYNYKFVIE